MPRKKFQWTRDEDNPDGELHFADRANRSERKRENDKIDALVRVLVKLKPDELGRLSLSEPVFDALNEARRIKAKGRVRGGLRRQLLFVAGVLRNEEEEDVTALMEAVEKMTRKR